MKPGRMYCWCTPEPLSGRHMEGRESVVLKYRLGRSVAAGGLTVLTGCGAVSHPQPAATHQATADNEGTVSASPTPSVSAPLLTMQQAAAVYTRIVDPGNRAGGVLSSDVQDKVPFSQYQRDAALYVTAVQRQEAELRAVRWPAKIQPYITAMLLTDTPADVQCTQSLAAAGSYTAAQVVGTASQACSTSGNASIPDEIRRMFSLPPVSNP